MTFNNYNLNVFKGIQYEKKFINFIVNNNV